MPDLTTQHIEFTPDNCLCLMASKEFFDEVLRSGRTTVNVDIDDNTYKDILETVRGNLIIRAEALPETFHSCYWWNNGQFPYVLKDSLKYLLLANGERALRAVIRTKDVIRGTRFRFQGVGKPSVEDPDGHNCIWTARFGIEVIGYGELPTDVGIESLFGKPRVFLLRWNPAKSSFNIDAYRKAVNECPRGFGLDWTVFDWQQIRVGDIYYMLRLDEDNPGIMFRGNFRSTPYTSKDWTDSDCVRYYADITCEHCKAPEAPAWISLEELQRSIPEVEWAQGHSGVRLPESIGDRLEQLWNRAWRER